MQARPFGFLRGAAIFYTLFTVVAATGLRLNLEGDLLLPAALLAVAASLAVLACAPARQLRIFTLAITALPSVLLAFVAWLIGAKAVIDYTALALLSAFAAAISLWSGSVMLRLGATLVLPLLLVAGAEMRIVPRVLAKLEPKPVLGTALESLGSTIHATHFGKISVAEFRAPLPDRSGIYTALAPFGDGMIWADAGGRFFLIDAERNFTPLDIALDMNTDAFLVEVRPGMQTRRFSVKDIDIHDGQLYATHHYWHSDKDCYTLRVVTLPFDAAAVAANSFDAPRMIYETAPCLPVTAQTDDGQLMEAGGRLGFAGDAIILTLGDNMHDGRVIEAEDGSIVQLPEFAQDPSVDWGKTLRIDPDTGAARIFTSGHRNPQGLDVGPDGTVVLAEHGPKGGDEINFLRDGANYGWPRVTYGTDYGLTVWPLNAENGEHRGFAGPEYAFIPSIGISAVRVLETGVLPEWKGDILVASLRARSLFRLRHRGGKVVTAEQIEIGYPVRDLLEMPDGRIAVATTNETILMIENARDASKTAPRIDLRMAGADAALGAAIYEEDCAGCHALDPEIEAAGPHLAAMFSPEARRANGFGYSSAFTARGIDWTRETLDLWLADPAGWLPGTSMTYEGLADPQARAHVIAYLESLY